MRYMEEDDTLFYHSWGALLIVLAFMFIIWEQVNSLLTAFSFFLILFGTVLVVLSTKHRRAEEVTHAGIALAYFGCILYLIIKGLGFRTIFALLFLSMGIIVILWSNRSRKGGEDE
ncbi:MAG: hypothetical protein J7L88_00130 [Thermoplasmata archaeon]|nr:hypothetical protein [Thermoplasmata archaeon]